VRGVACIRLSFQEAKSGNPGLVVDVIGIDTQTWLTGPGGNVIWFPSDVMRVTERMWRPDANT
jgi:hypothetical protein